MEKIKVGDWIKTDALDEAARVVVVLGGIVKVEYYGRYYFFREDEVRK